MIYPFYSLFILKGAFILWFRNARKMQEHKDCFRCETSLMQ
jgi:hypothetical protein